MHAERPWAYPMTPASTANPKGRPNEEDTPENQARCLNCPMVKLGYTDCTFTTVKACKRAERLCITPAVERHSPMMPRAHMKRMGI